MPEKLPEDVEALYDGVAAAMDTDYGDGRKVGNCQYGVYLFYDYDGEPIMLAALPKGSGSEFDAI